MRYSIILMGMAASTVLAQDLDLGMINSAPAPIATGPDATATAQTVVYNAAASGSAAVTGPTSAAALNKRELHARTLGSSNILCAWFGWGCPAKTSTPAQTPCTTTSTSAAATPTASSKTGTAISSCPVPVTTYVNAKGATYLICPGTDYQGTTSTNIVASSAQSCADACASTANCVQAIYSAAGSVCYIKSGSLSWVINPAYTAIILSAPAVTTSATSTSSSASSTITSINTSIPTPTGIPSTCTNTWTNTNTFVSATGCPTLFETGTYCGFVNPEDPCADQPKGSGPVASPDTAAAFLSSSANSASALNAKTPSGYAQTFQNLQGSTSAATYLGLSTLTSYDVAGCAASCDATSTCTSFNIYIERDPALNPSTTYCCPNPSSFTNYKCTLWGSTIDATTATNAGQWREGFQVVITGSNGYTKANTTVPVTPPGTSNPQKCSGVHSHPSTCLGKHFFPGPYNPQLCASYAQAQNIKNGAVTGRGSATNRCGFFNSYMLKKNGAPLGTYCSLFATQYDPSLATYQPGQIGNDFYSCESSWTFQL